MQTLHRVEPTASLSASDVVLPAASEVIAPVSGFSADSSVSLPPQNVTSGREPLAPILVADDDPDDRFFIRRLISKTGTEHPVRVFDDGSEVVNYLGAIAAAGPQVRKIAPRLLFLDLRMTGLGGFGFLEWARQQKSALPLTIVVLSNSAEPADMAKAMELGAHRYLVKYPSVHTFGTIIRSVYPQKLALH
jgi:CheY-like chemotaxis protein